MGDKYFTQSLSYEYTRKHVKHLKSYGVTDNEGANIAEN